mmetsp:Transcript_13012/g.35033  ORF Transcript_13012/g.35033 Transcript_13012/m.35033 type:complete len:416 (+) Transcript_13012:3-1250(+)
MASCRRALRRKVVASRPATSGRRGDSVSVFAAALAVAALAAAASLVSAAAAAAFAQSPLLWARVHRPQATAGDLRLQRILGGGSRIPRRWFFGWGEEKEPTPLEDGRRTRFLSYAEGTGPQARLKQDSLKSLLECTDNFCLTKHWLADSFVDRIYKQYAHDDGITLQDFSRLAQDGLLLEGKLDEYEQAFAAMDVEGTGLISRETLGKLFAGLGSVMSPQELDKLVDEADIGHDGIDFADFLGFARTHLELKETLQYLETHALPASSLPVDLSSPEFNEDAGLQDITLVHGEKELGAIIRNGRDTIVELAFSWCRPCKGFEPKLKKYAQIYKNTRFVKIIGNENESCKHYAKEILKAKISPMFAVYSGGKIVDTWHGANTGRFIESIERFLPSAGALAAERAAAVEEDPSLAPKA